MRSHRPFLLGLLALTLLVRGLMPAVHGSMNATDRNNPILAAFCGTSAAALVEKSLKASFWAAENQRSQNEETLDCPQCVASASAWLLLVFALLLLSLKSARASFSAAPRSWRCTAHERPPVRAPPGTFSFAI